jgi:hypothetical protein
MELKYAKVVGIEMRQQEFGKVQKKTFAGPDPRGGELLEQPLKTPG